MAQLGALCISNLCATKPFEYINESDKEFKERYQEKFNEFEGQYIDGFNKLTKDLEDLDILTDTIRIQI
ncbi:hypothetical protein [Acinetobacter baumannii]|uniref:hypothetical protein n=1 Tax=Acinetobacter baumannii TaxID=470 RepID=UPI003F5E1F6F